MFYKAYEVDSVKFYRLKLYYKIKKAFMYDLTIMSNDLGRVPLQNSSPGTMKRAEINYEMLSFLKTYILIAVKASSGR